jgi:mannose-6-phosphate isomerase-like protein (cupin superfamily)
MTTRTPTLALALFASLLIAPLDAGGQLDRTAVDIVAPADIKWVKNAAGTNEQAILFGDPGKPGPYVIRLKWLPTNNFSRPHTHPNDRFFVVISGTWWVGSGTKYDPDSTVPVRPGSYVVHYAGKPHYDGAKTEEAVIQVWGMGPNTTTSAEVK